MRTKTSIRTGLLLRQDMDEDEDNEIYLVETILNSWKYAGVVQ